MKFIALIVFGFIALSVLYLMISVYSRSVRREGLEKSWDSDHTDRDSTEREDYITQGMAEYERGFRKKLIVLVYVLPVILVTTILILTN